MTRPFLTRQSLTAHARALSRLAAESPVHYFRLLIASRQNRSRA